jgi:hypothetical protein
VFFASKFTEGAWLLLLIIPALLMLFERIERYYHYAGEQLGLGTMPERPSTDQRQTGMVIVPIVDVSRLTETALNAAFRMGGQVIAVAVSLDPEATRRLCDQWTQWNPGVELRVLPSPHRSLVAPIVGYVHNQISGGRHVTVLLAEVEPRQRRYQILHNQRGLILAAALRARTDAVVATIPFRLR